MKLTNLEMSNYLSALNAIKTKVTGKFAFIVAKNIRKLSAELVEFESVKNDLICKHGEINEAGEYSIAVGSDEYHKFVDEFQEYCDIKQEVEILKIDEDTVYNSALNAEEMLQIDFMIQDTEEGQG